MASGPTRSRKVRRSAPVAGRGGRSWPFPRRIGRRRAGGALLVAERLVEPHGVLALDAVARMEHALGPVAVVGEQQQALGIAIESAHRIEPRGFATKLRRNEVEDGFACVRVADRARHAGRLGHHQVDAFLARRCSPDVRPRRATSCAGSTGWPTVGDHPVHRDATGRDHLLGLAPRGDARVGERLLNANAVTH